MTTALITGVTGQDGSYLAERLLASGWTVHGLVRAATAEGEQPVTPGVVEHVADLSEPDLLREVVEASQPDVIVNLAAASSVARSWEEPVTTSVASAIGPAAMLDASWRLSRDVRFVQASSAEMFGNALEIPQSESTPIAPVSPYGAAKAFAHHLVGMYRARGMAASSAILYNHESPRRPPAFVTRKITMGVAAIAAGRADSIELGNLDARRDWGWAPDYVEAIILMAEAEQPDDYVIATGTTHSVRDFVAAAFRAVGIEDFERFVRVDARFLRPVDAPELRGDASKIKAHLGWAPTRAFDDIVRSMVEADVAALATE